MHIKSECKYTQKGHQIVHIVAESKVEVSAISGNDHRKGIRNDSKNNTQSDISQSKSPTDS